MKFMLRPFIAAVVMLLAANVSYAQRNHDLKSPDGRITVSVQVGPNNVTYSVMHGSERLINPSPISLTLNDGSSYGENPVLRRSSTRTVNQEITSPVYKRSEVTDHFNELKLEFRNGFDLIFRAYDDGVAYRFVSHSQRAFTVENEQAVFNFPGDQRMYVSYVTQKEGYFENQFLNSFENTYDHIRISEWNRNRIAFLPLLVEYDSGKKICITEADLFDYPGMYLCGSFDGHSLIGIFAQYPSSTNPLNADEPMALVRDREYYLAHCGAGQVFPWRVIVVAENDSQLADSDMVYKLSTPSRIADPSWIVPGKVAWEWWNDWNVYGVDFEAGINNETYKYYIDFASKYGIEYIILDEGWAVQGRNGNLMEVVPEIDIKELVDYGAEKNVGIILWAEWRAFDRDMENVCRHYSQMGVKGFKVDFMDRDDQIMVQFMRRAADTAARNKLLLDFHGTYKPTGLYRTFPNVINYEGVYGLEQMKWATDADQVTYDVTIPFIRMVAGPMDYTQGAMRNATKAGYRAIYSEPMSQGTRSRQLAQYVVFESPLNMLCDSPSNYMQEEECTWFIAGVPTVWDQTVSLDGRVAEYVAIARRKGNDWYVGGMTNWDEREMEIDLSFLSGTGYKAEIFRDGPNAAKAASDYVREFIDIPADKKLKIDLAPGGGFAMKIYR